MTYQTFIATALVVTVYLVAAWLVHVEDTKKRVDFTLCPLCGEKVTVNQ